MADVALTRVTKKRQKDYQDDLRAFVRERRRLCRNMTTVLAIVAILSLAANVGQAWLQVGMLPLHKVVPGWFVQRQDGEIDYYASLHDEPESDRAKGIVAAVWKYTKLRQRYVYQDAQEQWDLVSAMSVPNVRDAYQDFMLSKDSPVNTIGPKGTISVKPIGLPQLIRPLKIDPYGENTFNVRFQRTVSIDGALPVTTDWTATVVIDSARALPASAWLNNSAGVIVLRYSADQDTP